MIVNRLIIGMTSFALGMAATSAGSVIRMAIEPAPAPAPISTTVYFERWECDPCTLRLNPAAHIDTTQIIDLRGTDAIRPLPSMTHR